MMAPSRARSLALLQGRLDVPIFLAASVALLYFGLTLPVVETSGFLFWHDTYSIWWALGDLWDQQEYFLASVICVFSIGFPALKLLILAFLWIGPLTSHFRRELLTHIEFLSRWAMLDVFVVAMLVVIVQAGTFMDARPREGIYCFGGSVVLSMLATLMINRATAKQR